MLWINKKNPSDDSISTFKFQWNTHYERWEQLNGVPLCTYETINSVEAMDFELHVIKVHFENIPFVNQKINRWFGDHAKFIAAAIINWE